MQLGLTCGAMGLNFGAKGTFKTVIQLGLYCDAIEA